MMVLLEGVGPSPVLQEKNRHTHWGVVLSESGKTFF